MTSAGNETANPNDSESPPTDERRRLNPEAVSRARSECEAQGTSLAIRDELVIVRFARALFETPERLSRRD